MVVRISLLLTLFFSWAAAVAQVTTTPTLPVEGVPITITFDATQGDGGLKNYTGDVYAHAGLITDKSTSSADWKYVLATWTTNVAKAKMTRVSANIYTLSITPDIRTFYGVATGEVIKQMAFVFRSADQTVTGRATGGKDIMVDVYSSTGLSVAISAPQRKAIVAPQTTLPFLAGTTATADLKLYSNNVQVNHVTGTTISYNFNFTQPGDYWLKVVATSGTTVVADSAFINVLGDEVAQTLPSGSKKGVNYIDGQTVRLVLWAPFKSYVYAIGDFNNWLPTAASRMKRAGDYFWLDIPNLTSGKEYPYQYWVDGKIRVADPYTDKILDPNNDSYITSSTYPNLIAYPTGKTDGITSVFQPGQQPYSWQVSNYSGTKADTMVVYECLVRDFDSTHSFAGVTSHLDYLKTLGVNVLELMPVNEFEGNSSWGYNPSFYFAPDKYYGPKNELKKLVDECHKRGIALVMDMVLNHSYGSSPFVQLYFDGSNPTAQNPWYNVKSNFANPSLQWGYDFNHDSQYTQQLVDSINSYWMSEYKVDGFRFDFTVGFSNTAYTSTSDWGSSYDAARITNLKRMAGEIWKRKAGATVIFEHFSDNPERLELSNYGNGILLWTNLNYNASQAAMGYLDSNKSDLSSASYNNMGWSKPGLMGYMESHDEERILYQCVTYGNSSGSYDTKTLTTALNRAALTAALFLPIPGPKMLWQFEELGYDISINSNGRLGEKPIHWEYQTVTDRANLNLVFSKLIALKKKFPIFSTTDYSQSLTSDIKWIKLNLNGEGVLIAGNFGLASATANLAFQKTGTWYDYFGQKTLSVTATPQAVLLAPGEYKLFSTQNFGSVITGVNDLELPAGGLQISPNPASDHLWLQAVTGIQQLQIISLTGRVVRELKVSVQPGEQQEVYVGDLASGLYLIRATDLQGHLMVEKFIKRF